MASTAEQIVASETIAELLTDYDLSDLFRVDLQTIRRWVRQGKLRQPLRIGAKRYWRRSFIDQLFESQPSE